MHILLNMLNRRSYLFNLNTLSQVAATLQTEMSSDNDNSVGTFTLSSQDFKGRSPLTSSPISSPSENEDCFSENNSRLVDSDESLELVNNLLYLKQRSRSYGYGPALNIKKSSVPRSLNRENDVLKETKLVNKTYSRKKGNVLYSIPKKRQTQGRPYTNSINARFYMQDSIDELYCYLNNVDSFAFSESLSSKLKLYQCKRTDLRQPQFKKIHFDNSPPTTDLFVKLCETFEVAKFKFVKIIRNIDGKLVKIETVDQIDSIVTAEWIKQNVCRPRYKSNMKIQLIRFNQPTNECIYKDKRLFELDIENVYNCLVKIVE